MITLKNLNKFACIKYSLYLCIWDFCKEEEYPIPQGRILYENGDWRFAPFYY